jgi:cytochrome c
MMRRWVIAGIALAASTGTTLAQDAAAGEQVFRRVCSPCHDIGEEAKIKLGPPLNGIDARKAGTFEGFNYSAVNKSSGITWSEENFPKYIRAPMQEMPGTRMAFVGIKKTRTSPISGLTSSNLGPMATRNEPRGGECAAARPMIGSRCNGCACRLRHTHC